MVKIVTTSQLQKTIGQLLSSVKESWLIVTNKGKPSVIMLPYFDDNEDAVADYLEEYVMRKNAHALRPELQKSLDGGLSDVTI